MSRKKTEPIAGYDKCGNCINQEELDDWDKQQKKKQPATAGKPKGRGRHYIYVAKLHKEDHGHKFVLSYYKKIDRYSNKEFKYICTNSLKCLLIKNPFPKLKLKKGEQKKIPIDIEKAEKV